HVAQHGGVLPQQRGHHGLRDEVLGPTNGDLTLQRSSAVDLQYCAHTHLIDNGVHRTPTTQHMPRSTRCAGSVGSPRDGFAPLRGSAPIPVSLLTDAESRPHTPTAQ